MQDVKLTLRGCCRKLTISWLCNTFICGEEAAKPWKIFRKWEGYQNAVTIDLFGLTLKYPVMSDREKEFPPPSKTSFEITRFPNVHDTSMSEDEPDSEEFEATPFVDIRINGVEMEGALVDDFFWKYGNSDGNNILGLTAEAHFVRKLRKLVMKYRWS